MVTDPLTFNVTTLEHLGHLISSLALLVELTFSSNLWQLHRASFSVAVLAMTARSPGR